MLQKYVFHPPPADLNMYAVFHETINQTETDQRIYHNIDEYGKRERDTQ
jgi:hypothetical protein